MCECRGSETIEIDVGAKSGTFVLSSKSFIAFAINTYQTSERAADDDAGGFDLLLSLALSPRDLA